MTMQKTAAEKVRLAEKRKFRHERRALNKADPVTANFRGEAFSAKPDLERIQKYIIDGADLERTFGHEDETVIFHAINNGDRVLIDTLIAGGANLNHKNKSGQAALELLVNWGKKTETHYMVLRQVAVDGFSAGVLEKSSPGVFDNSAVLVTRILKLANPEENWTIDAVESRYQSSLIANQLGMPLESFVKDTSKPDPEHWSEKYKKLNTVRDRDGNKIGDRSSGESARHVKDMIVDIGRSCLYPALYKVLDNNDPQSTSWAEDIFSKFITNTLFAAVPADNTNAIALPKLLEMANRWDRNRNVINKGKNNRDLASWESLTPTVQGPSGYYFVPLTDSAMLDHEGTVLSHCVAGSKSSCLTEGYQIYGVRRNVDTPEYTAGYRFSPEGKLVRFTAPLGYKNMSAPYEVHKDCEWFEKNVVEGAWGDLEQKSASILNAAKVRKREMSVYVQDAGYDPTAEDATERAEAAWKAWAISMDDLLRYRKKPLSEVLEKGFYKSYLP